MPRFRRSIIAAALGCALLLGACAGDAAPPPAATQQAAPLPDSPPPAQPNDQPPPGEAATTPPADASPEAARAVIVDFYAAINEGDYRRAYLHWADAGGASQQSFEQFRDGFAATAEVAAEIGEPFDTNAGAGSIYTSIPVTLAASQTDGSVRTFQGAYVLRRANDVPGSTAEQRRWHIQRADIR